MLAKFSKKRLRQDILKEAKILGMHMGSAEIVADKVVTKISNWVKGRTIITEDDLDRVVARELEKYNSDLAFVYFNHDKII